MKAIFKQFLYFIMLLSVLTFSIPSFGAADAGGVAIDILRPENGDMLEAGEAVALISAANAAEIIYEFDGKEYTETNVSAPGFVIPAEDLTVGSHALIAYAIGEDGTVASDGCSFSIYKDIITEKYKNNFDSETNVTAGSVDELFGENINSANYKYDSYARSDALGNSTGNAVKIYSVDTATTKSWDTINIPLSNKAVNSDELIVEFDIIANLASGDNLYGAVREKKSNPYVKTGMLSKGSFLIKENNILNGESKARSDFIKVKAIYDISKNKLNPTSAVAYLSIYIDSASTPYHTGEAEKHVNDTGVLDSFKGLDHFFIQYTISAGIPKNSVDFILDNLNIYGKTTYTGIGAVALSDGRVVACMNEEMSADSIDKVKLISSGRDITSSVEYANGAYVITPKEAIASGAEYEIIVGDKAKLASDKGESSICARALWTAPTFGASSELVKAEGFFINGTKILSDRQIQSGATAKLSFDVDVSVQKSVIMVFTAKSGNKMTAMTVKPCTINSATKNISAELIIPNGCTALSGFVIDDWNGGIVSDICVKKLWR